MKQNPGGQLSIVKSVGLLLEKCLNFVSSMQMKEEAPIFWSTEEEAAATALATIVLVPALTAGVALVDTVDVADDETAAVIDDDADETVQLIVEVEVDAKVDNDDDDEQLVETVVVVEVDTVVDEVVVLETMVVVEEEVFALAAVEVFEADEELALAV